MYKILIGIPSLGEIRCETVCSLIPALSEIPEHSTCLMTPCGCYIHQLREFLANQALESKADYLMFIDSDMVFTADAIRRLLNRNKDIIGANYNYKLSDRVSVTKIDPDVISPEFYEDDPRFPGVKKFSMKMPTEPIIVRAVGTGFLLIKTDVFRKIPKPWFWFELSDDGNLIGEDVYFCDKAKKFGFDVWCDPTIPVGHIGTQVY